ncbi:MAG TPA: HEAT repeat domain-containing protein [Candidatus Brocadiia bacterium]|nr:HEAT repeat domain-containing protein [Candidatus Brocadiales bacterium]
MKRFVIYGFAVGIVGGFFIGIFSGNLRQPVESPPEKLEHGQTSLSMPPKPEHEKTSIPIPQSEIRIPQSENWSNVLITLEDACKKKDWKAFIQTLEGIQGDEKYPLPGIVSLLKNGFAQSVITSIQDMDIRDALFIAEDIVKGNSSKHQKMEILRTIGEKGKDVTPLLKWVLENEKDMQLSVLTLNAMGETKDPELLPFLLNYAQKQHEMPLRLAAIEAFENFDSNAIEYLESLLSTSGGQSTFGGAGKNEQIVLKSAIIETLGNIGSSEAASLLSNLARNQEGLKNEDSYILQQDAITALGEIGSPEALLSIGEIITNEGMDAQLRGLALDTLARVKKDESIPILEAIINDRTIHEQELKKDAISALGDIKEPEAVSFLAELITKPNNEIPVPLQMEALSAMGRIGGSETVPVLETIINNAYVDSEVRKDAIFTLGKVGTDMAASALERIVNDSSDPIFTRTALRGLQKIGNSYALSIIESAAREHPSEEIRLIASKLLETPKYSR